MANGKTKNYKNVEIPSPKKNWSKIVGGPLLNGEKKTENSGEYTGSTPAFSSIHHAAQRGVRVCMLITFSKNQDQPGKVASPARGQLNRENENFLLLLCA